MRASRFTPFLLAVASLACTRHPSTGVAAEASASPPATLAAAIAPIGSPSLAEPAPSAEPVPAGDWVEAVRMERWDDAWSALDALPKQTLAKPKMRLVRARIALARGDAAAAVPLLEGLEKELPAEGDAIARWRADAQATAGPYEEAARWLAKQPGARSLSRAAIGFEKAGLGDDARRAAERAIAVGKGQDEAVARAVRLRLAEAAGQKAQAAADARWLAVHAPAGEGAKADEALARLDPDHPLDARERMQRADAFAQAGRTDDALTELERAGAAKGKNAPTKEELAYARGTILYRARGRYLQAAAAFDEVAKKRGPRQAEAMFYAARARSRADHDDEAARAYREVARRFPKTPQADEATYLVARLGYLHGRFGDAIAGYATYLRTFARGRFRDAALYERAVSLLAARRFREAKTELGRLASGASGHEGALLRTLHASALAATGDKTGAVRALTDVAAAQPLSFAALAARERLSKLGAPIPPLLEPSDGKAGSAIGAKLPEPAALYHELGLDADAEASLRARERELASGPRKGEQLCELYGELSRAARRYRIAIDAVPAALVSRAPSGATAWAWSCLFPRPYAPVVEQVEAREKLPTGLVFAVMRQESAYDPDAVSPARAVGLLQLLPETAKKIADESGVPFDGKLLESPPVNIDLGARYLAKMLRTFDGSVPLAVAAYNAGPRAVGRWVERSEGLDLDLFVARIPYDETRTYVLRVMSNLARYAYLQGGEAAVPRVALALPKALAVESSAY